MKTALFLLGALVLAGGAASGQKGAGQDKAKCVATCKADCKKSYDICKRKATSTAALEACQTSLETCNGNCVNKACR